jgi:hypothetical protein
MMQAALAVLVQAVKVILVVTAHQEHTHLVAAVVEQVHPVEQVTDLQALAAPAVLVQRHPLLGLALPVQAVVVVRHLLAVLAVLAAVVLVGLAVRELQARLIRAVAAAVATELQTVRQADQVLLLLLIPAHKEAPVAQLHQAGATLSTPSQPAVHIRRNFGVKNDTFCKSS